MSALEEIRGQMRRLEGQVLALQELVGGIAQELRYTPVARAPTPPARRSRSRSLSPSPSPRKRVYTPTPEEPAVHITFLRGRTDWDRDALRDALERHGRVRSVQLPRDPTKLWANVWLEATADQQAVLAADWAPDGLHVQPKRPRKH
jgi:hypothetical protein